MAARPLLRRLSGLIGVAFGISLFAPSCPCFLQQPKVPGCIFGREASCAKRPAATPVRPGANTAHLWAAAPGAERVPVGIPPWWRTSLALLGCILALAVGGPAPVQFQREAAAFEQPVLNAEEQQTVSLYKRNTPGVVFITNEVYQVSNARRLEFQSVPTGTGSGWVYDNDGHVITNYHVIKDANVLTVKFIDGTTVEAKVVGADPGTDIAVLLVDLPSKTKKSMLKPLRRGDSSSLSVGQEVYAIGNPFGLEHTLTKGIVSGLSRTIMSIGGRPIQGAIQTDASINPGNSGGPLINSRGDVIGMNTSIISPAGVSAGVGFAIPSDTITARTASILKYGYVKRPSLGIYLGQDGTAKFLVGQPGCWVGGVQRIAVEAGIRPGDIITEVDKHKIECTNDLFAELDEHEPGDTISVGLLRTNLLNPNNGLPLEGARYEKFNLQVMLKEAIVET